MTKICLISDTHGMHKDFETPECDILIHAGDFSNVGEIEGVIDFLEWFKVQPAKYKVFIAGNHDKTADNKLPKRYKWDSLREMMHLQKYEMFKGIVSNLPDDVYYLKNNFAILEGLKIYGSPYSPSFGNSWAFNADRGSEIAQYWSLIPKDVDILVTHTPAFGILDVIPPEYIREGETENVGCKNLLETIKKLPNLKVHCSGHIHDNFGFVTQKVSLRRRVTFCNAAVLTNQYSPVTRYPIILNL